MFEYNESFTNSQLNINFKEFNKVLSERGTRLNPLSCNALSSYPPPKDYTGN